MLIKPAKLVRGDTVAFISLSWGGAGLLPDRYNQGKRQFEQTFGCKVIETPNGLAPASYLYEHPELRAADLMWAFKNPEVKAIIANIGGDDSIRMLPHIDYDIIRNNPKIFMGFSDSTVTNFICNHAGVASFYGPAVLCQFSEAGGIMPYVKNSIEKVLFDNGPIGVIPENKDGFTYEFIDWFTPAGQTQIRKMQPTDGWHWIQGQDRVSGKLFGGCLEVIETIKGTSIWHPERLKDAIMFFEISEHDPSPEQVLFWLRNYGATGILANLKAILFGRPKNEKNEKYEAVILKALREYGRTDMPVVTHMDFGHTDPIMVMPYGVNATIDCEARTFEITESAVV
ncbi:MAG: LD-carboxypeptidase [Alphaproteobacteria bacterium]|nr:LD-carboxypeptidase [Alphaproteobacteria bacterium]